ncbi:sensor histidine kinase [Paenibacillus sp. SI8]|uniref:sensor histidine kinase n=1 Tax=unclassified Paenibacillus TaxID=185978 RepID=UPI0034661E47
MSKRKLLLLTAIFLIALTGLRLLWLKLHATPAHPEAVHGVVDLRNWDFENNRTIPLDGEWEFYPNQFIIPLSSHSNAADAPTYIQVPGSWQLPTDGHSSYGFGSYRLRILTTRHEDLVYGLIVNNIQSSSELVVNGKLLARFGKPAEQAEQYVPYNRSYLAAFESNQEEIEIIVRIANFDNPQRGGMVKSIQFGSQALANFERLNSMGLQLAMFVVLLLHGLYASMMYVFNRRQRIFASFLLLTICAAIHILIDDDAILLIWLPINYTWATKIAFLSYVGTTWFTLMLTQSIFSGYVHKKVYWWLFAISGIYTLFILLAPVQAVIAFKPVLAFILLFSNIIIPMLMTKMIINKHNDAIFLLIAGTSTTSSILWDLAKNAGWVETGYYPFDILAAFLGLAAYGFKRYFWNAEQMAHLAVGNRMSFMVNELLDREGQSSSTGYKQFSSSELPVVLLTTDSRMEDSSSGYSSGANDYVTKPVGAGELIDLKQSVSESLRMEAAYLQAQIQPHFLFNTLNSITALSHINIGKMHDMIEAFSSYLRISFDLWNLEQRTPLEYELELVRSYLYIEKQRFEDRLNVVWDVHVDVQLQLPPLVIQPLVENAVRHGILTRSRGGTIHVRIMDHPDIPDAIEISVEDDGAGMDPEKVRFLLDHQHMKKRGIGLLNTDRRLKQMYGQGLCISSEQGVGTKVSFVIPKQKIQRNTFTEVL